LADKISYTENMHMEAEDASSLDIYWDPKKFYIVFDSDDEIQVADATTMVCKVFGTGEYVEAIDFIAACPYFESKP
jgi:hypothetical protein